jgi:recombinational DNA repair protein RecT
MAKKTVLRQLLGTWGVLSSEMETVIETETGEIDYDGELPETELVRESDYDNVESMDTPQSKPEDTAEEAPPLPEPPPNKPNQLN